MESRNVGNTILNDLSMSKITMPWCYIVAVLTYWNYHEWQLLDKKHTDMSLAFIDDLGEKRWGENNMCLECKLEITLTTLSMFY